MTDAVTAIKQTLARYCHTVDQGTPEQVAALFHLQACLKPNFDGKYNVETRDNILRWYRHYTEQFKSKVRHLKHDIGTALIEVNGARATSQCYFLTTYVGISNNQAMLVHGTYTDTLVEVAGEWQIMTRQIDISFAAPLPNIAEQFPTMGWTG